MPRADQAKDQPASIPAMAAGSPPRDNPLTRSIAGVSGLIALAILVLASLGTLPWTMFGSDPGRPPRFDDQILPANRLPPSWLADLPENWNDPAVWGTPDARAEDRVVAGYHAAAADHARTTLIARGTPPEDAEPTPEQIARAKPLYLFGTDNLGRSLFIRTLAGGAVSIGVGLAAATISVFIGTLYGALAGYLGGKADAVLMRIVDVLYGLPYILLVVLLAVAGDALVVRLDNHLKDSSAERRWTWMLEQAAEDGLPDSDPPPAVFLSPAEDEIATESDGPTAFEDANDAIDTFVGGRTSRAQITRLFSALERADQDLDALTPLLEWAAGDPQEAASIRQRATQIGYEVKGLSGDTVDALQVLVLLTAIGGVSWLTMARVIRGQVLSLKSRPFMEAARAMGVPARTQFARHLLPNLIGPIVVYATLTVPQAILQESFLSFLGIGIQPPLPSWGNLAAAGLSELNTVQSRWWLLFFPCALLGLTLLALNFVGEGLREAFDPKRARK